MSDGDDGDDDDYAAAEEEEEDPNELAEMEDGYQSEWREGGAPPAVLPAVLCLLRCAVL